MGNQDQKVDDYEKNVNKLVRGLLTGAMLMAIAIVATIAMKTSDAKAAKGTWVQTGTYKNGAEQYVSKQNEYYKYRCYYRGVT